MRDTLLKLIIMLVAAIWVWGCASTPSPTIDQVTEQALPDQTKIPDQWTASAPDPPDKKKDADPSFEDLAGPVDDNWIKSFKDPELETLVQEAMDNNPGLRIAAANLDRASAADVIAGASLKPAVAAGAVTERTQGSSPIDTNAWAVGASWELDLWGKLRARAASGEAQYEATLADYKGARQSLAALTAKTYFLSTEAYQQRILSQESVNLYQRMVELAETRFRVGKISKQDVHLAKADLSQAQERLRKTQTAFEQAARSLELLLGRYPKAEIEVQKNFAAMPVQVPMGLPGDLLTRRQDLVAADRRVAAAFQRTIEAQAAKLPSIQLTAGGGQASNDLTNLLGVDRNFFNVGANFLAPLYTGGTLSAQVDIATADQETALAAYGQTALTAFGEVEIALSNETLLTQREAYLVDVVKENANALKLAEKQYEVGRVELLNVLIVQARLIGAQASLISIQNDRLANRVNLHLALGGSFENDED